MNERLTTRSDYAMRLERVFRWLADHLDDTLDLTRLAEVAAMSPYHSPAIAASRSNVLPMFK